MGISAIQNSLGWFDLQSDAPNWPELDYTASAIDIGILRRSMDNQQKKGTFDENRYISELDCPLALVFLNA
ncbi:MAG: hypothetical protein LBU32_28530 [Clostridiales bacterium]|nr:hypothetical protein [Clostridiales bacterium]